MEDNKVYGRPKTEEKYIKEFYCGICHQIPVMDIWDQETGLVIGNGIDSLFPVPMAHINGNGLGQVQMMTCRTSVDKINSRVMNGLKKKFGDDFPTDGGAPVKK